MYDQSSTEIFLGQQRRPLSEVNNKMQCLTRRAFMNLTSNAHHAHTKLTLPAAASVLNANHNALYSTERPQQKLLRFPAFPLEETMKKFIKTTEPLLNEQELRYTQQAAEKFIKGDGAKLQALLEKTATREDNWLASRWLKAAYLQYRDPVTVFSSPGMIFPWQKFNSDADFVNYTSKTIFALIKYKQLIDNDEIPVAKMGKNELDNSQFERVFGTCRIPKPQEDGLEFNPNSKYVVVIFKNHFYKLPVYNKKGEPLHAKVLSDELVKIMSVEQVKGIPYGILSTDSRDNWAAAYDDLNNVAENKHILGTIQKSLFTVSLDETIDMDARGSWLTPATETLIHGGGSEKNAGNRWMDKTIQLVVNRNGMSGFTYEHSPAEGQPIALMTDYVIKNLTDDKFFESGAHHNYEASSKLPLSSTPRTEKHIEAAKANVNKLASNLQVHVLRYQGFGKNFLKSQKMSPDSFIQIALQFAFYATHNTPAAHYESAHLRIYVGGRTETIRSCSNESIEFSKAMIERKLDDAKLVELLRKAVNGHRDYTMMALQGQGVDRHLLGLKLMALENGLPVPEFYQCPGVVKSAHFRLSTSQVASAYTAFMGYGPLTDDGYGCCYNPRNDEIILALSAWRNNKVTCADNFAKVLTSSLDKLWELLCRAGEKPTAKL